MEYMQIALEQARLALEEGEVPVGCAFIKDGRVLSVAHNGTNLSHNATHHCEILAIRQCAESLSGSDLYVTCEPCIMCAEALALVQINKVFFGCWNERFGGNGSILAVHHGKYESEGGILKDEAIQLFKAFYQRGNPNGNT